MMDNVGVVYYMSHRIRLQPSDVRTWTWDVTNILSWCWWNLLTSANLIVKLGHVTGQGSLSTTWLRWCVNREDNFHRNINTWIILLDIWLHFKNQSERMNKKMTIPGHDKHFTYILERYLQQNSRWCEMQYFHLNGSIVNFNQTFKMPSKSNMNEYNDDQYQ